MYLPFAALYYLRADYSFLGALKEFMGNFILTGETPLAWHMWYLHTLIISVAILLVLFLAKLRLEVLSVIVFAIAGLLDCVIAFDVPVMRSLVSMIDNYQNFVMTGLPAIITGALIKKYEVKMTPSVLNSLLIIATTIGFYILGLHAFCIMASGLIFLLSIKASQFWHANTLIINECSKYVYFLHLLIAFMLRGRIENVLLYWLVVVSITMMLVITLYYGRETVLRRIHINKKT